MIRLKPFLFFGFLILAIVGIFIWSRSGTSVQPNIQTTPESTTSATTQVTSECPADFTPEQTEGPYYIAGSPQKGVLAETGVIGEPIIVTGVVFDKNCQPIANAWLDFWQADGQGNYDNQGYKLRGHQFTDSSGKYLLKTVMPGKYPGRPPHIHVKVRAKEGGQTLTSQLYFPGNQNEADSIFNPALEVSMSEQDSSTFATYNFKLND